MHGTFIEDSDNNIILHLTTFNTHTQHGLFLDNSHSNIFYNLHSTHNNSEGIYLLDSSYNTLVNTAVLVNDIYGVWINANTGTSSDNVFLNPPEGVLFPAS